MCGFFVGFYFYRTQRCPVSTVAVGLELSVLKTVSVRECLDC